MLLRRWVDRQAGEDVSVACEISFVMLSAYFMPNYTQLPRVKEVD